MTSFAIVITCYNYGHYVGQAIESALSQTRPADEIIVQSSRVFLGLNVQCISCHSGKGFLEKVNLGLVSRKRSELWAMASFFGKTRVGWGRPLP